MIEKYEEMATVSENDPKSNDANVGGKYTNLNLQYMSDITQENLTTRLQNTFSYAGPVLVVAAATGVILAWLAPTMPEAVVTAFTTLIGFAFNMVYDIVRWYIEKNSK